jgi:hypothetical protein
LNCGQAPTEATGFKSNIQVTDRSANAGCR